MERGQPVCGLPGLQREYKVKAIMVSTFFRTCLMFIPPPPPPPNNYWGTRLEKGKLGPRTLISYSLRPVVFLPPSQGHSGQALSLSLCGKDQPLSYSDSVLFLAYDKTLWYDQQSLAPDMLSKSSSQQPAFKHIFIDMKIQFRTSSAKCWLHLPCGTLPVITKICPKEK